MPAGAKGSDYNDRGDRVREETCWRERLTNEAKFKTTNSNFQMNLIRPTPAAQRINHSHNRIELVTEKELHLNPSAAVGHSKGAKVAALLNEDTYEFQTIRHLDKTPTEKWDISHTSAHEVGWYLGKCAPVRADQLATADPPVYGESARSITIPTLTNGKWTPRSTGAAIISPPAPLDDIGKLNTPRWRYPKKESDVGAYFETYLRFKRTNPFSTTGKPIG